MPDGPTLVLVGFFAFVLCMTKVLSDNWTKRKLVEARVSDDVVRTLFRKESDPEMFAALKWGIVLVSIGVGLIALQHLRAGFDEPLAWGVVLVFGGAGLLAYYAVARALVRRDAREAPGRQRASFDEPR